MGANWFVLPSLTNPILKLYIIVGSPTRLLSRTLGTKTQLVLIEVDPDRIDFEPTVCFPTADSIAAHDTLHTPLTELITK